MTRNSNIDQITCLDESWRAVVELSLCVNELDLKFRITCEGWTGGSIYSFKTRENDDNLFACHLTNIICQKDDSAWRRVNHSDSS